MRFKQKTALLLASVMLVGSVGMINPTEVRAEGATNTFTLTVPADTNITTSGWNDIGNIQVSNVSIASGKKISVTIEGGATERTLKKTGDESKTVGYEIKKGNATTNEAFGTSLEFTDNGTQAIGAVVADFSAAEAGTYEDTITFTAALADTKVTYNRTDGTGTLSTENLGTPTSWTYSGTTYQVYNAFISSSSGSSWNDAMGFVAALNTANYGGYNDWTLLSSQDMATAYAASENGAMPNSSVRGVVDFLWSSVEYEDYEGFAYCLYCLRGNWSPSYKTDVVLNGGFVVLRGSSKSTATAVIYERTGEPALSSENLGTPTSWTYSGTTYQVYNEFIPSSSGSSWNDAMGFVAALNTANYGGYNDWTLLRSKDMATAWYNSYSSVSRGAVDLLWSSVERDENGAYGLYCNEDLWGPNFKTNATSALGFVVLRGSSN